MNSSTSPSTTTSSPSQVSPGVQAEVNEQGTPEIAVQQQQEHLQEMPALTGGTLLSTSSSLTPRIANANSNLNQHLQNKDNRMGSTLIDQEKENAIGQLVLESLFIIIESNNGWNVCLGLGKRTAFFESINEPMFNEHTGMLNMVKRVRANELQKKFGKALKVLEKIASTPHSDGAAGSGEQFPPHLQSIMNTYLRIVEEPEPRNNEVTPAQIN